MISKTRNLTFPLQIFAVCTLLALNAWYPGREKPIIDIAHSRFVYMQSNWTLMLPKVDLDRFLPSDWNLAGNKYVGRSPSIESVAQDTQSMGLIPVQNLKPSYPLKVFDMAAFKASNIGPDAVDLGACILAKYLRVTN